ncbi:hypothetical protein ACQQ4G_003126 [Listeria monocytogenes]
MLNPEASKYIDLIMDEPYKIGHWVGFEDLKPLHNEWIKMMMYSEQDETLLAHRGSYKTTCLSVAIALIMILRPKITIIFLRKTDTDVKEVINQVTKILKSAVVIYLCQKIYGIQLALTEESSFNITTNLFTSTKGASQLLGLGIKSSITGKHADLVITDDIVNMKDRISKAERDLTKAAYMELQNIKNRDGRILNTGTPWHKEDAITNMPNKHIYDCYNTGLISRSKIEEIRQSMTPSLFAANYELKHIADEEALFTNPSFTNDNKLIYNGICHIDASYGGADGTAFTIIKKVNDNFVVFGKRWNKHVDDCLNEIDLLKKSYLGGSISCETNADKGYLAKELRSRKHTVNEYSESMNKFIKISTYLRKNWAKIKFLEDTDPDYINEILDYTEDAEHDDAPDSLASILRKITGNGWLT